MKLDGVLRRAGRVIVHVESAGDVDPVRVGAGEEFAGTCLHDRLPRASNRRRSDLRSSSCR